MHYNIRHVSSGRPVPYCHAVCESHEVSLHVREVTCTVCCDFIDGFTTAVAARDGRTVETSGAGNGRGMVLAAFLAAGLAASAFFLRRYL